MNPTNKPQVIKITERWYRKTRITLWLWHAIGWCEGYGTVNGQDCPLCRRVVENLFELIRRPIKFMTKPNNQPIEFNVPVPPELKPELASWLLPRTMFETEVQPVTFDVATSSLRPPPVPKLTLTTVAELMEFVKSIEVDSPGGAPGILILNTNPPTIEIYDDYRE